jgi:hypothetical protein
VYWPTRWTGSWAKPGRTDARYSRTGILRRRQLSSTERIAATFGPACSLPTWIQFFRLCAIVHKRNYVPAVIMCCPPVLTAA